MLSEVEASPRPFDFAQGDFDPAHAIENRYKCTVTQSARLQTNQAGKTFAAAIVFQNNTLQE